ncbi:MAG: hypothetical protein H0U35_11615 [Sporichthyaceae bacterium]|nr:hypothetical protein [Sporichthyaceae bacterium]
MPRARSRTPWASQCGRRRGPADVGQRAAARRAAPRAAPRRARGRPPAPPPVQSPCLPSPPVGPAAPPAARLSQLAEVDASRARILAAGDEERRQIERDLHDGAQQRLVTIALALRLSEARLDGNADPAVREVLRQTGKDLGEATDERRCSGSVSVAGRISSWCGWCWPARVAGWRCAATGYCSAYWWRCSRRARSHACFSSYHPTARGASARQTGSCR